MKINCVTLNNYRSFASLVCEFFDGVNLILGDNGQGKTNLVEAIILSCIGRSPRTPRDKELITWGESDAYVKINGQQRVGRIIIETAISETSAKSIKVNGFPIRRMGELMGNLNCVFFSPDELRIVKSSPGERRHFLDISLSQLSKGYFYTLSRYNQILYQRNKLLKSGHANDDMLDVWDEQLSCEGAKITRQRREFLKRLNLQARESHAFLTNEKEELSLIYEGCEGESVDEIKSSFLSELKRSRARDLKFLVTNTGVQKDDFKISANSVDLRCFGSQGQQRTAALSLKLAELRIFEQLLKEPPILILDDVMSELDVSRQEKLLQSIEGVQTFITGTNFELQCNCATSKFLVKTGTVCQVTDSN